MAEERYRPHALYNFLLSVFDVYVNIICYVKCTNKTCSSYCYLAISWTTHFILSTWVINPLGLSAFLPQQSCSSGGDGRWSPGSGLCGSSSRKPMWVEIHLGGGYSGLLSPTSCVWCCSVVTVSILHYCSKTTSSSPIPRSPISPITPRYAIRLPAIYGAQQLILTTSRPHAMYTFLLSVLDVDVSIICYVKCSNETGAAIVT